MPLRPNPSLSRAQEYIDLYCKTGDIKVNDEEIANEIDEIIETIMSTDTQKVSCQPISHLMNMLMILTFGGEKQRVVRTSTPVTVMKKCRVVLVEVELVANFLNKFMALLDFLSMQSVVKAIVRQLR
jgi:hypothetical protein